MVNGTYALINGAIIVDKIVIIAQVAEPAIAADSVAIWCDTTVGLEKWWLVFGTDGLVTGNKKVEMG